MPRDLSLTMSDFDPEHEALASTREIHVDEPDYMIHDSTIDRAFPEFSQLPTSSEDEAQAEDEFSDHSFSMELGRAAAKPRRVDDSRDSVMSFENSVRSSSPAVRVEYNTPRKQPAQPVRNTTRRAANENLRKDAQLRQAAQAQTQKEAMSPQISKSQRDQRRSLSDMHAKVRESYDGSFLGDERPVQATTNSRSTRFANPNQSQEIADAVERAAREAYAKETRKSSGHSNAGTPRKTSSTQPQQNHTNTMGETMTRNSFLLPDLPNISELVSGVYEDGTPVFPRQSKMRSTRFVSPPHDATDASLARGHMPLDAVPIPDDEKALFVNLRLLQDKVSELQMFKSDAEKRIESYRAENAALKAGRSRNSDKYEVDEGDYRKSSKKFVNEIQKLETANLALQNQLDIADRKSQVQEAAVKRLNQDRESAISQLGVAYLETRELKIENEALRQENMELQSQIARVSDKAREQDTGDSEAISSASEVDDSQVYTERSGDMSRSTRDLTNRSTASKPKSKRKEESRSRIATQVDKEITRLEKERADEELFSLTVPTPKRTSSSKKYRSEAPRVSESKSFRKQPNTSKQRVKRVVLEDLSEPVEMTEQSRVPSDVDELTLLSVIDENEISRLRRTLEEERLLRKQRRSSIQKDLTNETANSTRQSILKTTAPAPRKSSLREPKPSIPRPASATGDITSRSVATVDGDDSLVIPTADRQRRHSDHSVASVASRKKRAPKEDMTSAFILPDITLSHAGLAASNPSRLPESAQKALDDIAQHNGKNCTVCKNVLPNEGQCDHEPIKVPQPVPVSERMPEPSVSNPEPTIRPSQPPAVALSNVLKALEDELSHLRMQLISYQTAYNKLDASISKRQRKSLKEKVDTLMREIDQKSDQIYALYDVLEDHKTGNHMTEQEMEQTLESIGIDVTKSVDLDEESELPWEGIESTAELTGRA